MASRNPAISTPLRAPEVDLSNSRKAFIQQLENKKQFEADCAQIIPELDRQWKEKILDPFKLPLTTALVTTADGCEPADKLNVINWRHYLYNYTPQLLSKAITRLVSRLKLIDGEVQNTRGVVANVSAYYKSIVQDMRRKEVQREKKLTEYVMI